MSQHSPTPFFLSCFKPVSNFSIDSRNKVLRNTTFPAFLWFKSQEITGFSSSNIEAVHLSVLDLSTEPTFFETERYLFSVHFTRMDRTTCVIRGFPDTALATPAKRTCRFASRLGSYLQVQHFYFISQQWIAANAGPNVHCWPIRREISLSLKKN